MTFFYKYDLSSSPDCDLDSEFSNQEVASLALYLLERSNELFVNNAFCKEYIGQAFKDMIESFAGKESGYFDNVGGLNESGVAHFRKLLGQKVEGTEFNRKTGDERAALLLSNIRTKLYPTIIKHLGLLATVKKPLSVNTVEALYRVCEGLGISTEGVNSILLRNSQHGKNMVKKVRAMPTHSQVRCYIYTALAFLQSRGNLDSQERAALQTLRKAFLLDFTGWRFWKEYVRLLEGNHELVFDAGLRGEREKVFAACSLVAFSDGELHPEEKLRLKRLVRSLGLNENVERILDAYKGTPVEEIVSGLSDKAFVFFVVKALELVWADKRVAGGEGKALERVAKLAKRKIIKVRDAEALYLLFLSFLFENPDICEGKSSEVVIQTHRFLSKALEVKTPLRTLIYFLETHGNARGIVFEREELQKIFNCLELDPDLEESILSDCLDETWDNSQKRNMLLGIFELDRFIDDAKNETLLENLEGVLKKISGPGESEKSMVAYFVLRAILLDRKVEVKEAEFFENFVFKHKVDQSHIREFCAYLLLETAVKYRFDGWIDYGQELGKRFGSQSKIVRLTDEAREKR